jgi:hypothetical protein
VTGAIKDGGPAFPVSTAAAESGGYGHQDGHYTWQFGGLTMRDYFAAKALAALLSGPDDTACEATDPEGIQRERNEYAEDVACDAYRYADAMIKARGT